jgi:hypothetical protein
MVDVPNLPGVPNLPSYSPNTFSLLVADAVAIFGFLLGPSWGIFLDGAQAFDYNSIVDFDYKQDSPISDYPVEEGSFLSYDKVQLPFDVKVRVASGTDESSRQALLAAVSSIVSDLNLYDVVTPEQTYSSCNCTHADFKRTNVNGVGLIVADFWFIEIRQTATSTFSNTQTPAVAGQQSAGNVAPLSPQGQIDNRFPPASAFSSGGSF